MMRNVNAGLNRLRCNGSVCWDRSLKYRKRTPQGVREWRHGCWRADVTLTDCGGTVRVRKRFRDREAAVKFVESCRFRMGL